jgi:glucose-6-phosphate-specific signal transduction histidine kinase
MDLWRDAAIVVLLTLAAAFLSVHFELGEAVLAWTGAREYFQLDELPGVLLVMATCAVWFAWRRYREARTEIGRRRGVESDLATALTDNRVLAQHYVRIWDSEQRKLARELHDELGQ